MRKDITIVAEERTALGKAPVRRLRAAGQSPATIYGVGGDPISLTVDPKEINKVLQSSTGHNSIFNISINGQSTPVMIVDWQYHPVKGRLLHVDLQRIDMTKRLRVKVPIQTVGDPKGVKLQGGIHDFVTRELEIECLPDDIPEHFTVDVSELMIGQAIRAGDIPMTGSMKLLAPPDAVISHVTVIKALETPAEEAAATTEAEPEVMKKGKKEEEAAPDKKAKK